MNALKKPPLESTGQFISPGEFQFLTTGFVTKFPDEMPSVFLSKQVILDCINTYPDLAGISFRYGLTNANDPFSRKIILIPCQHTTDEMGAPDHVLLREGYICNDGEKVALDQFWTLLGNHVERAYNGKHHFVLSKIHRGYFWGIQRILQLLDLDNCGGLVFHFGYHVSHPSPCKRNQNVLEAVGTDRQSLHIYMEYGQCTPPCTVDDPPGGGVGGGDIISVPCLATTLFGSYEQKNAEQQLNRLREFRDDYMLEQPGGYALYEMYYYVSRPILRAIQALPEREQIYADLYHHEMKPIFQLMEEGKPEQVLALYKNMIAKLLDTYVFETVA